MWEENARSAAQFGKAGSSRPHKCIPRDPSIDRARSALGAAERRRREITVTWNAKGKAGTGGVDNSFRRSGKQIPIGIGYVRSATCWGIRQSVPSLETADSDFRIHLVWSWTSS